MYQTRFCVILPCPIHNQFTKGKFSLISKAEQLRDETARNKRETLIYEHFHQIGDGTGMEQSRGYLPSEYRPLCRAFHQPINIRTCYQLHIRPQICVCSRAHRQTDIVAHGTDCVLHILAVVAYIAVYEKLAKTFIMSTI